VRVLLDYRPALRERSGVGEYVFQLSRALLAEFSAGRGDGALDLTLFSSSWKDRFARTEDLDGAAIVDRRVPVRLLNLAWHRLEWPSAETLAGGRFDIAHSPHPLLMPARHAARVVTIHDLYFLTNPEHTRDEVKRDYAALARDHARRADRIIVPSQFTASEVEQRLGVPADRISICPHGRPDWRPRATAPEDGGYILFFGTLEPRKNVGGLLDAYESAFAASRLRRDGHSVPELVLAGKATEAARPWLERIAKPPLAGRVRHIGYVDPAQRRQIYEGARLLVQPSFEEGFGFPVLEAMTLGVPVVAANRGALPEVLGDAGILVDPENAGELAAAIEKMSTDEDAAASSASRGITRARQFDWRHTARCVREAYQRAIDHRSCASA
jgi:glycosyltransferase involved in cell wall biosynthesis